MIHHKTWFPVLVLALTLLLGFFIYSLFKDRVASPAVSVVSAVEYQSAVHGFTGSLRADLVASPSDATRIARLEQARDGLLTLIVPGDDKDVHLEMVMTISQWILGYQGARDKQVAAEQRWQTIVSQYPWIE